MRFTELFKPKKFFQKPKVGVRFYQGNYVYFVDEYGIPRVGIVKIADWKDHRIAVTDISGPEYKNPTNKMKWISTNQAVRTREIWCGTYGTDEAYKKYMVAPKLNCPYERMPKRPLDISKATETNPSVHVQPGDFIRTCVDGRDDCWIVFRDHFSEYSDGFKLINYFDTKKIGYMTIPIYDLDISYLHSDPMFGVERDIIGYLLPNSANALKLESDGFPVFGVDDIKEVWSYDPYYWNSYGKSPFDADPNHMSKKYDRRNFMVEKNE